MTRIPVILDTDPGVDDNEQWTTPVLAILLALASPELEILAIVCSFGNTDADSAKANVLKLFAALERQVEKFPDSAKRFPNFSKSHKPMLACGARGPLEGKLYSAGYFHGRDGLGDITTRHPHLVTLKADTQQQFRYLIASEDNGPQVILDLLRKHPVGSITYCALGPLTTLALTRRLSAADQGPHFDDLIGRLLIMGGALDVPGNTSPVAEFNFMADPFAVEEIMTSALAKSSRTLLMPLDITEQHTLPFREYINKVDPKFGTGSDDTDREPLIAFTSAFLERLQQVMNKFGMDVIQLHGTKALAANVYLATFTLSRQADPLVIACAVDNKPNEELCKWKAEVRPFQMETVGKVTRGMCVVDRRGTVESGSNRAEHGEIVQAVSEHTQGIHVVVETLGREALNVMMLSRIWGR